MKLELKKDVFSFQRGYIYAETAFAHEGDLKYLYKLVDESFKAKVNGIKFQMLMEPTESYTKDVLNGAAWSEWIFSAKDWENIIKYARYEKNMDIIILPVDMCALEFCEKNKDLYDMIEVHSINFNQKQMLARVDQIGKPVILGVGGRTLSDIEYAILQLKETYIKKSILLMHGFQSFPTNRENIKLERIRKLRHLFDLEVGYADHTSYDQDDFSLIQFAYLSGARFFEKHIIIDKGEKRTDYQAAVDSKHFIEIRERLDELIMIQGSTASWDLSREEWEYRSREKKIVALRDIYPGEVFTDDNIGYKVTSQKSKFEQREIEQILGKTAGNFVEAESCAIVVKE